ncbi:MAG: PAS domain S-box protein, partial [Deltaproteobacteria bacterium]|nr:PAS domain S-box protein [Deltaproteobacteria bacterium]
AVEITRKGALKDLRESEERYRDLYEASKRQEELYRSFLNSSADAIIIYDRQGEAQYVSPSFTRIFGWTLEELKAGEDFFIPDAERGSNRVLKHDVIDRGGFVTGFETERNTREGAVLDVSISASPYHDHRGRPSGMSMILRDITPLKSLDRARRKAVNHLAHELVTPVALIEAAVKRLGRKDISASSREKNLERIGRNLDRLRDIQDVVQGIAAPPPYRPRPFQADRALLEVLDYVREKSVQRTVEIVPDLDPLHTDLIDPDVFAKAVATLLKNAIENTPDGGKIHVLLKQTPEGVLFRVADCGVGISPPDREFIFKGFYHTQQTRFYATRKPYAFNAGGKGLELMRLKLLSEEGAFDFFFESRRCRHLADPDRACGGIISSCPWVGSVEECMEAGGSTFSVLFFHDKERARYLRDASSGSPR